MSEKVIIGRFLSTYGINGAVEVDLDIDFEDTKSLKTIFLQNKLTKEFVAFDIKLKKQNNKILAHIKGISTQEQAKGFCNSTIFVEKSFLTKKKDSLYLFDIFGKEVYLDNGKMIGKLTNIFKYGTKDYIEIDFGKFLVPAEEPFLITLNEQEIILSSKHVLVD